jgi:hypothetical protein
MTKQRKGAAAAPASTLAPKEPPTCPVHHVELEQGHGPAGSRAWCPTARAFSQYVRCPFVCEFCRLTLDWDGGCSHCHGCMTGARKDWTFPGDRYEYDGTGHRRLTVRREDLRVSTQEENAENMRLLRAALGRVGQMPDEEIPF